MGFHETGPEDCPSTEVEAAKTLLGAALRPIIWDFLRTLHYSTPPKRDNKQLKASMLNFAESSGVLYKLEHDKHAHQCFVIGLSVASDMYPSHPLQVQLHIAIFTWLGTLIDDTKDSTAAYELGQFQTRFFASQPQPTPLLKCFAQNMRKTYRFWDLVTANFIVPSSWAFLTANVLERRQDYRDMAPDPAETSWAYHFRNIEDLPEAYTYFMFPRTECPDITVFLQAVPDMDRFINLTNDVMSFYKEEVAAETNNYIQSGKV